MNIFLSPIAFIFPLSLYQPPEAILVFAAMNLKKMATWLWRRGKSPLGTLNFYPLFGVLKKILSRYIQPLFSELGKQGLKFCLVNKLKQAFASFLLF